MSALNYIRAARAKRISAASRAGVADGIASAFRVAGRERPAPPTVQRELGSLREDGRAIERDGERLFGGNKQ